MFSDITEHLFLEEPIRDISWDAHLRRLAVRTVSTLTFAVYSLVNVRPQAWEDVYIITLNPDYHAFRIDLPEAGSKESPTQLRGASAMRLRDFSNHDQVGRAREQGVAFNGIHMTRTVLWLVWDVWLLAHAVAKRERAANGMGGREPKTTGEFHFADVVLLCAEDKVSGTGMGSICFLDFTYGL